MATFYKHLLEEGSRSLLTTDSHRLQRNRVDAGLEGDPPVLTDEEAKKQGVYGYYGDLYCPNCRQIYDFIFVEFERPYPQFLSAWREIIKKEMDEDVMICPRCGHRNMELI